MSTLIILDAATLATVIELNAANPFALSFRGTRMVEAAYAAHYGLKVPQESLIRSLGGGDTQQIDEDTFERVWTGTLSYSTKGDDGVYREVIGSRRNVIVKARTTYASAA